jgi:hypothetical protein
MGAEMPPRPNPCLPHQLTAAGGPADLLSPAADGERWTLLYTRSNCERLIERACGRWAIRHYLPLAEQWCGPDHARRRALAPLFPSYVFACMSPAERQLILELGHLTRMIPVAHPDLLLVELRQIRDAILADAELTAGPALAHGTWVRVVHGPLAGVVGRVEGLRRRRRRHRLVMNVSVLGRGVETEIDVSEVERVAAPDDRLPALAAEGCRT